jgi:subtilisin family serine protease
MKKQSQTILIALCFLFVLSPIKILAQESGEYIINVGNEQLRFVPRPELGYVIKTEERLGNIRVLSGILKDVGAVDIKAVRGFGEQGVYVVKNQYNNNQNKQITNMMAVRSDVEYVLPLFEVEGAVMAIMPEIIARLRREVDLPLLMDFCKRNECRIIRSVIYTNVEYLLEPIQRTPEKVLDTIDELNKADFIKWAVPDVALEVDLCGSSEADVLDRVEPNDEYFPQQWHLDMIRAPEAWVLTQGDPNIVVAVIDNGFDIEHPDLVENIWRNPIEQPGDGNGDGAPGLAGMDDDGDGLIDEDSNNLQPGEPNYTNDLVNDDDENGFVDDIHGWNFLDGDNRLSGGAHGTWCAGLIAAKGDNGLGVTGVTWDCKIMPIQANLADDGCVRGMAYAEALRYAAANGADVISNSWHIYQEVYWYDKNGRLISYSIRPYDCLYIHSAVRDITERDGIGRNGKGCIVLAASGNWSDPNDRPVSYPAAYPEVIAVGAIDRDDRHWSYSGSGPSLDIVAPSGNTDNGNLWTTDVLGSSGANNRDPNILDYTDKMGGTSGACPIAAGVAALVLSIDPNLTSIDVHQILLRSARDLEPPGWDEEYGFGCVDAFAAVTMVQYPSEGSTLFVDDDAPNDLAPCDPNEDGSIEHPYDAIQEAINNSIPGGTIVVLAGTYSGTGNYNINSRGKTIYIRSESGPENCVVDCEGLGRGFLFSKGIFGGSMLEGLTITNGNGHQLIGHNAQAIGGAIVCWEDSHVTIDNCRLTANSAELGGAIHSSGELTIVRSEIKGNIADKSGGGLKTSNDLTIIDSIISGNSAHRIHGGGIAHVGKLKITNSVVSGNSARNGHGGGIFLNRSIRFDCMLDNCTLGDNTAGTGGALYSLSHTELANCIVWNNALHDAGGTMFVTYSDIQGGFVGEGNIDADPLFADVGKSDYHLKSHAGRWDQNSQSWIQDDVTSPCIDAGDPNSPIGDEPIPNGGRINMGAYGGTAEASKSFAG